MPDRLSFRRLAALLLLAVCLLGTQYVLAEHGVGHAFHDPDEICVECLALPGMQGAPPPARATLPVALNRMAPVLCAVPPAPTFKQAAPFQSRAPPLLQG